MKDGKEYCFLSNIDNLGATLDFEIIKMLFDNNHEFLMEVTEKTKADVKGGTLIDYDGKLRLLEEAQVPKEHKDDFKCVKAFDVFNTNNLWINLHAIKRNVKEGKLDMEVIVNTKVVENDVHVIQLETAVGAAMKFFRQLKGIKVPRSRFLPVKKTSDLFLIMSNLYKLQNGILQMSPERLFQTTPLVKLGNENFMKVSKRLIQHILQTVYKSNILFPVNI